MLAGALDYFRSLREYTSILAALTAPIIKELGEMTLVTAQDSLVLDAFSPAEQSQLRKLQRLIRAQELKYEQAVPVSDMRKTANRAAKRTDALNRKQVGRQLRKTLAVRRIEDPNTTSIRGVWTRRNVSLIKTIGPDHFDRIEKAITRGFQRGSSVRTIQKDLAEIPGITRRRAALIARDQTGTLNSKLTRKRHTENGITKFEWIHVDDERVRPEHEALDGRSFDYNKGAPGEGFPGDPIQCRCYPDPVL